MTQGESKKDVPGRKFDQSSSGSNSAGSMGPGGTGDIGSMQGTAGAARQSAGRTDDLLSDGSDTDQDREGGAGGHGRAGAQADPGSRQSVEPRQPAAKRPHDD